MPQQNRYDKQHIRLQAAISKRIRKMYEDSIISITPTISKITYKGKQFKLSDYPQLQSKVEAAAKRLHGDIYATSVNGIKDSWTIANKKNDVLVDKRLAGGVPSKQVKKVLYDTNKAALTRFIERKENGMNLSDRVWNLLEPYKKELEQGIGIGIGKGKPAKEMAKELQRYLNEPDKLFRRVRGEDGKLYLSEAARNYNPGRGVYRSSYKNALRLTRTENNLAYRASDFERWKNMPFVTGIHVQLSKAHPAYDICDKLVGDYPKDFKFTGWHPQCLCYATAKQMTDEEYNRMEDQILNGDPVTMSSASAVTQPPAGFGNYLKENKDMLAGLKNKPYWMRDNPAYLESSVKLAAKPVEKQIAPGSQQIGSQFTKIQSSVAKPVKTALNAIDAVHGDGILQDIPFVKSTINANGAFHMSYDGKPLKISLTSRGIKDAGGLTIAHEMGHYLDYYTMGENKKYESVRSGSPVNKIVGIAKESKMLKELSSILQSGIITVRGQTKPLSAVARQHINYLLDPKEVWARAYAQFIAEKSQSADLLKSLNSNVQKFKNNPWKYQWETEDFKPIFEAIESMMLEKGWIVSQ